MVAYFTIAFLAVFLALIPTNKKFGLNCAFLVITIFLAIRYMWGNDYPAYLKMYQDFNTAHWNIQLTTCQIQDGAQKHNHESIINDLLTTYKAIIERANIRYYKSYQKVNYQKVTFCIFAKKFTTMTLELFQKNCYYKENKYYLCNAI